VAGSLRRAGAGAKLRVGQDGEGRGNETLEHLDLLDDRNVVVVETRENRGKKGVVLDISRPEGRLTSNMCPRHRGQYEFRRRPASLVKKKGRPKAAFP